MLGLYVAIKNIFFQVVSLIVEFDSEITFQELSRRLFGSVKFEDQTKEVHSPNKEGTGGAEMSNAEYITNFLVELGRSTAANYLEIIRKKRTSLTKMDYVVSI